MTADSPTQSQAPVLVSTADQITAITLNRPDRMNALTPEATELLADLLEAAAADESVRLITVTGAGRGFCAGADLAEGIERASAELIDTLNRIAVAICAAPKPVLAVLNGPAVGAGASLALACDLIIASSESYLKPGFEAIGLVPDGGGTALWTAALGRTAALRTLLLGDPLPADEALQRGIVAEIHPAEKLGPAADRLAQRLASGPTRAYAATKQGVNGVAMSGLADALAYEREQQTKLLRSDDFAEGMAAFREKRRPRFRGQ